MAPAPIQRAVAEQAKGRRFEPGYEGETWLCANHALMVAPGISIG
jgi:hypothetical protein